MGDFFLKVLDWAEVWAILIPLIVLFYFPRQPVSIKPVIVYLWLAFFVNLLIDLIMAFKDLFPSWFQSNNPLYNLHSVIRYICFSVYFLQLPQNSFRKFKIFMAVFSILFLIFNFTFFENFFNRDYFSGNLLAAESYLLLVYCMLYYLSELKEGNNNLFQSADFWVVTGLCIYVVINFFVFLFYVPMINVDIQLAINIWNVHNIAFIIFCLFITKALYGSVRYQHTV